MKKLMLAVAIVCAAAMAQAASTTWQATGVVDHLGVALNSSTLGAFTVKCAFYDGSASGSLVYTDTGSVNFTGAATGSFTAAEGALGLHTYYTVLTITDKDGAMFTSTGIYTSGASTSTINFASGTGFTTVSFNNSGTDKGWTNVPEPTSAMLMLIGMAGLALRRRRA